MTQPSSYLEWEALTRRHLMRLGAALCLSGCWDNGPKTQPAVVVPTPVAPVVSAAPTVAFRHGTLIGPGQFARSGVEELSFVLSVVNLDVTPRKAHRIPLTFFAHGVVPNPVRPRTAVLFEKKGKGACEVDLAEGRVLRAIPTVDERQFYGHGDFLPDGSVLYATETVTHGAYEGLISVRDGKTLELKSTFPSHGASPHDCRLIEGGRVMVATNGGGAYEGGPQACVTWVEVASGKLLDKVDLPDPHLNAGHFALSAAGDLVIVSAPREGLPKGANGGISMRPAGGKALTLHDPEEVTGRLRGETLSVCMHEPSGVVACTTPLGDLVTFWDLKRGILVKKLEIAKPRGVTLTLDRQHFVITHGEVDVTFVTTAGLEPVAAEHFGASFLTGSHIINYPVPTT